MNDNLTEEMSPKIKFQTNYINSQLAQYKTESKKVFISSSFQTHSIPLLHIVSKFDNSIPVYFLNTGFHFPETLIFKDEIAKILDINVVLLESQMPKNNQKDQQGRFFFCSNSDYCCHINKVLPLEPILMNHDVWITGVRRDQSKNRASMDYESIGPFQTTRFRPMLDWDAKLIWEYRTIHNLPEHPLEKEGYFSIGCEPCTQKMSSEDRNGRWAGQNKTECGLHTDSTTK